MALELWEESSKGVWLDCFTWQQNQGQDCAGGCSLQCQVPTSAPALLLWGSPLQIQCLEESGSSFAKREWSLWKQEILLEQMGKFQGIVSEFLAAGLGSHWPVAPEKCACLLQIGTRVGLAWLCDFHLPVKTQVGVERGHSSRKAIPHPDQSSTGHPVMSLQPEGCQG